MIPTMMPESRTASGWSGLRPGLAIALGAATFACGQATPQYVASYEQLLPQFVTPQGLVRYERLLTGSNRDTLDTVRSGYWRSPLPEAGPKRLAFLLNAYNVNVLTLVLGLGMDQGVALRSVKDAAGFFDVRTFQVGRVETTLNGLENDMIRPLRDPRIHAALVCAAMSCPPLRREPYESHRLGEQLDDQCRRFVNDSTRNRVDGDGLALSEIFKWYEADFAVEPYGGVIGFVKRYAAQGGPIAALLARKPDPAIAWIPYDWALNQAPPP